MPYPCLTRRVFGSSWAWLSGCVMMPTSLRAVSRGSRVSESSVRQYRIDGSRSRDPICTWKVVSVAPRSSRLNSSIFPRFRSQPIQTRSRAFHRRSRWKRKNRLSPAGEKRAFSSSIPDRAASSSASSSGMSRLVASTKSLRMAKCSRASRFASVDTSRRSRSSSISETDVSSAGTMTIVRACGGMPSLKSRRSRRRGRMKNAMSRCMNTIATSVAGMSSSSATNGAHEERPPLAL